MSNVFSTAISGLNSAVSRTTQAASNIVNASSTGKNIDADVINIQVASVDYAANAKVIQTEEKNQKALLDIKV